MLVMCLQYNLHSTLENLHHKALKHLCVLVMIFQYKCVLILPIAAQECAGYASLQRECMS